VFHIGWIGYFISQFSQSLLLFPVPLLLVPLGERITLIQASRLVAARSVTLGSFRGLEAVMISRLVARSRGWSRFWLWCRRGARLRLADVRPIAHVIRRRAFGWLARLAFRRGILAGFW
jgi:hypothetical protein